MTRMTHFRPRTICLIPLCILLAWQSPAALAFDTEFDRAATIVDDWSPQRGETRDFGSPPRVPNEALSAEVKAALESAFGDLGNTGWGPDQTSSLATIVEAKDPRLAWLIADLSRFVSDPRLGELLASAASEILGINLTLDDYWGAMTDHLIAWDIPAPPGYFEYKKKIFTLVLPDLQTLMVPGDIDWRLVSWGGVAIDNRPYDQTDLACNCIPAADNPETTTAAEAAWLMADDIVFGITINGESRAYPRRIMEVREMVNDSIGGRDLAIPYCTLCGSAQAYFTDRLPDKVKRPVMRTSGLLIRSNKVMYDLTSQSIFDTFTGKAVTGPLADRGMSLNQASVVTTTWSAWQKQHPDTTVLAESLALGRNFDFRNNRDADGPIFPIGPADARLAVHEDVLGVISPEGQPVAFHVATAKAALKQKLSVRYGGIVILQDGDGLRAVGPEGEDLGSHQAFWFAWSQFHPTTALWPEDVR